MEAMRLPSVNLTATYITSLLKHALPGKRTEVWDTKTSGLCLRVGPTGSASWSFRYRPREGAGYRRVTLGSLNDLPLVEARDRAGRYRVEISDGADPQLDRRVKRARASNILTFERLAERYIEEYAKLNKSSWRKDVGYLARPRKAWESRDSKSLTRRDAIDLLDVIKQTAPVSANRTQSVLITLFNWAVEDQLLDVNPIAGLKKRAKEQAKDRVLSEAELRVIWHGLDDPEVTSIDIAAALRLILLTGQRPGEVAGMVQSELLDLKRPEQARWEIPAQRTKARRAQVVPLNPMAVDLISAALRRREADGDGESVFASRYASRTVLARHSLSQALGREIELLLPKGYDAQAMRSLQNDPPTPHDFRRTAATGLARLGIAREDRLAVLGHAPDDVHGKHYDKFERLPQKRIALALWEQHVAEMLSDAKGPSDNVIPMRDS